MLAGVCSTHCKTKSMEYFHNAFHSRKVFHIKNESSLSEEPLEPLEPLGGDSLSLSDDELELSDDELELSDDEASVLLEESSKVSEPKISENDSDKDFRDTVEAFNYYVSKPRDFVDGEHYGYIVKEELPKGSRVDFRSDFHGDFRSLAYYLESLKTEGILDDYYVVKEEYKACFKVVFTGDYLDRGPDSKNVLKLLMQFKLANPDNVELLRGNHETKGIVCSPCDGRLALGDLEYNILSPEGSIKDKPLHKSIGECFERMPQAYIYGVRGDDDTIEYTHVSHALFDPDVDISPLLASGEKRATMVLSKDKPYELSTRVKSLIPQKVPKASSSYINFILNNKFTEAINKYKKYEQNLKEFLDSDKILPDKEICDLFNNDFNRIIDKQKAEFLFVAIIIDNDLKRLKDHFKEFGSKGIKQDDFPNIENIDEALETLKFQIALEQLQGYIESKGEDFKSPVEEMLEKEDVSVSEARLVLNALYVALFVKGLAKENVNLRETDNNYTWADVLSDKDPLNICFVGSRGVGSVVSLGMIRAYANVMSSSEARLVNFVRGHEHTFSDRGDGLVHTLPVAGEVIDYDGFRGEHGDIDFTYSLQLAAKVAKNKLSYMKRKRQDNIVSREESGKPFFTEAV